MHIACSAVTHAHAKKTPVCFVNLCSTKFMFAWNYDLSSLGNFYSFSVDIIVLLFLVGSCTFCMYTLCTYYYYYYFILFLFLF